MDDAIYYGITFEFTSFKQTALNKQGSTHKNTCYKYLVQTKFPSQLNLV